MHSRSYVQFICVNMNFATNLIIAATIKLIVEMVIRWMKTYTGSWSERVGNMVNIDERLFEQRAKI